jgi:hypothetical protein
VIPNSPGASNASPPPQEHQPHVDPFPSLLVQVFFPFFFFPGEILNASNQEGKKKKRKKEEEK